MGQADSLLRIPTGELEGFVHELPVAPVAVKALDGLLVARVSSQVVLSDGDSTLLGDVIDRAVAMRWAAPDA